MSKNLQVVRQELKDLLRNLGFRTHEAWSDERLIERFAIHYPSLTDEQTSQGESYVQGWLDGISATSGNATLVQKMMQAIAAKVEIDLTGKGERQRPNPDA